MQPDSTMLFESHRPVKSFSNSGRLWAGFIYCYAGWFYSNIVFSQLSGRSEIWQLPAAWFIFFTGILAGLWNICFPAIVRLVSLKSALTAQSLRRIGFSAAIGISIAMLAHHIKICALERVEVSGRSMENTLHEGDIVWVRKWKTGLLLPELSFPFGSPSATGKLPPYGFSDPSRGEIVVFRLPSEKEERSEYFIKRVIAIPGDRYRFENGNIYLNEVKLEENYLGEGTLTHIVEDYPRIYNPAMVEEARRLGPEAAHAAAYGLENEGVVPPNELLVLGDNRTVSRDSRTLGFIPFFRITGIIRTNSNR